MAHMSHPSEHHVKIPHWHTPHIGEHRWPVSAVVLVVIGLQFALPLKFALSIQKPICILEALLLVALFISNPLRIKRHQLSTRLIGLILTAIMSLSNTASIWMTNIVVFGLWYWELDRGGPGRRAEAERPFPDFLFPQMSDPLYAPTTWHPRFFDYLYTSFTNGSAFSPTDVMPLTRWAKMLMLVQSTTSLVIVGLVIARAVNILR
jgi:uncharacterized membrane protein